MKKWLWALVGVIAITITIGFFVHQKEMKQPGVIKIVHISPLTGDAAVWGQWEKEGINLAVEQINKNGGIKGRRLVVLHEDSKADPKTAVSIIRRYIKVDKVKIFIGGTLSSTTLAMAPIAEKNRVILLTPSAQSPKISEAGDYIFRLFISSSGEGKYLYQLAQKMGIKKPALLYINNDYGVGLKDVIRKLFGEKTEILIDSYEPQTTDFRSQLQKVKKFQPDGIFLLGYPKDMALILVQMKEMGIKAKIFAPDAFEAEEIIKIAKDAAESVYYVYPILPKLEQTLKVKKLFLERYKKDMNIYNAMGYDAVMILATAIKNSFEKYGKVDGETVKKELYKLKNFPGVTGYITFDKNGDVLERSMEARVVKNGRFVKLWEIK